MLLLAYWEHMILPSKTLHKPSTIIEYSTPKSTFIIFIGERSIRAYNKLINARIHITFCCLIATHRCFDTFNMGIYSHISLTQVIDILIYLLSYLASSHLHSTYLICNAHIIQYVPSLNTLNGHYHYFTVNYNIIMLRY